MVFFPGGRTDGRTDRPRWMEERMNGLTDGPTDERTADGRTNRRKETNGRKEGRLDLENIGQYQD